MIGAMEKVRIIIIEDELHNSRLLNGMVAVMRPDWQIEAVLESVSDSVEWLEEHPAPDLILMDIQLADGTCFSIFDQHEFSHKTQIIFTTAYDQYAIRAFKVNSIDYLLKPIKEGELEQAFQKFERLVEYIQVHPENVSEDHRYYKKLIEAILNGKKEYRSRFLISGVRGYAKLQTKDIAFIYSSNKVTFAVDFSGNEHLLDYTLEHLEKELDPEFFFRANRQVIVNVDAVVKVNNSSGSKLKVITSPEVPFELIVSRLKASDLKKWLGK